MDIQLPDPGHRTQVSTHALHAELGSKLVARSSLVFELGKFVVPLILGLVLVHSLLVTIQIVDGPSMLPTLSSGSSVVLDRRDWVKPSRGDIVVLRYPGDPAHHQYIKRVVAGPGDTVAITGGRVIVNNQLLIEAYTAPGTITLPDSAPRTLAADEYFTLGDNRAVSNDSRFFGPVARRYLIGRVIGAAYTAPVD